jgi:hypothetical protein
MVDTKKVYFKIPHLRYMALHLVFINIINRIVHVIIQSKPLIFSFKSYKLVQQPQFGSISYKTCSIFHIDFL